MAKNVLVAVALSLVAGCTSAYGGDGAESSSANTTATAVDPNAPARTVAAADGASESESEKGPVELETVVSARWAVPSLGLINLAHPKARAAGLVNESTPIQLLVHVLRHPTKGLFVVDTGVPRGDVRDSTEGLLADRIVAGIEPVESLSAIVARYGAPLAGVLFTHMHIDHVLGLPEVPKGTPIWSGPDELDIRKIEEAALGSTFAALFAGHTMRTFDFSAGKPFGSIARSLDVFGDGSVTALHVPGHTHGSIAYYVKTTTGAVLLAGDVSHTRWGWENGVEPGLLTRDGEENAASLAALKDVAREHPTARVVVGHETDGVGTGLRPRR